MVGVLCSDIGVVREVLGWYYVRFRIWSNGRSVICSFVLSVFLVRCLVFVLFYVCVFVGICSLVLFVCRSFVSLVVVVLEGSCCIMVCVCFLLFVFVFSIFCFGVLF